MAMDKQKTGKFLGIPYDWRRPTWDRIRSRWWNSNDNRFFTPRFYGWGYDINLYWVFHSQKNKK
ncbi:MAG: DUF5808 domain-containing protein [Candidatus Saccharimonadales bacterium]